MVGSSHPSGEVGNDTSVGMTGKTGNKLLRRGERGTKRGCSVRWRRELESDEITCRKSELAAES